MLRRCFFIVSSFVVFFLTVNHIQADDPTGEKAVTFGPVNSNSIFSLSTNPSNSGVNTESVNLYTGQYNESFPLVSIAGRGGNGVSLSLDYNGNVTHLVKQNNHKKQVSPFGLGFNLGGQSIVCDHKSTTSLNDDVYSLIINGSSMQLKHVEDNRYVTSNGSPWIIKRNVAVDINGLEVVTGWTVATEDGTIYEFGDFDSTLSEFNATRYIFHYGSYVGNGVTNDDQLYPYTWDLSKIRDPESINVTTFDYWQELESFEVKDISSPTSLVSSANSYTRASYLDSITTPEGSRIKFEYSDRLDYQPFYQYNIYEFYSTKKAESIKVISSTNDVLSITRFSYEYLNDTKPNYEKLLLTRIDNYSGDESEQTPPLTFEYFKYTSDLTFGAIKYVNYSSGSVKEIFYSELDESENLTDLDEDFSISSTHNYITENLLINISNTTSQCIISFWDGYWHTFKPNYFYDYQNWEYVNYDLHENDIPGLSPKGVAYLYSHHLNQLMTWKWIGGAIELDSLTTPFTVGSDEYVRIYPTEDAFVVVIGRIEPDGNFSGNKRIREAWYYRWDGTDWSYYSLGSFGNHNYSAVKVKGNVFAISYYMYLGQDDGDHHYDSWLRYGAYDEENDVINYQTTPQMYWNFMSGNDFALGVNSVGYFHYSEERGNNIRYSWVSLNKFQNSAWVNKVYNYSFSHTIFSLEPFSSFRRGRVIVSVPNGFVYAIDQDYKGHYSSLEGAFYSPVSTYNPDGWERTSMDFHSTNPGGNTRQIQEMHGTSHYILGQYQCQERDQDCNVTSAHMWAWNGTNYFTRLTVEGQYPKCNDDQSKPAITSYGEVYNDSYAWGSNTGITCMRSPIFGRQYLGNNTWTDNANLSTPTLTSRKYTSSENYVIGNFETTSRLYLYAPYYYGNNYQRFDINSTYYPTTGKYYAAGNTFYVTETTVASYPSPSYSIFKLIDLDFRGTVKIVKVDSVAIYEYKNDTNPKRVRYSYYKGLVDTDGVTPKFTKVEASLPYYHNETFTDLNNVIRSGPEGWNVTYFYNDKSQYSLTDGHYDQTVVYPRFYENTQPPYYNKKNGGYLLDGQPYLTYSYSVGGDLTEDISSTKYLYQFVKTPDSLQVSDVYRTQLAESHSKTNGIWTKDNYYYDSYSGLISSQRTSTYLGPIHYSSPQRVTTTYTRYAFQDLVDTATANAMKADNALSQVLDVKKNYGSSILSASGSRYAKHGNWVPVEEFTWRDYSDFSDTLYLSRATDFDSYGNQISSINTSGLTSAVKFNYNGTRAVATGANCNPDNLIVQDFEQGVDWDGWSNWSLNTYRSFDTDAFTGDYSFKLADNPDTVAHNWGPAKEISGYDLTTSDFYFSAWVKSNHKIRVFCFTFDNEGIECNKETLEFSGLDSLNWQKIEGTFSGMLKAGCYTNVVFRWILVDEPENPAPANAFVNIDNIRLHPIDAHITTTVYDKTTGLVSSSQELNNIPKKFEYDKLHRVVATKNYKNELLSKSEYHHSTDSLIAYVSSNFYSTATIEIDMDQNISWRGSLSSYFYPLMGMYVVKVNGVTVDSVYHDTLQYFTEYGNVDVQAGDIVDIMVDGPGCIVPPCWSSMTLSLYYFSYNGYQPDDPNWTKVTSYASGENGVDSTLSISYYNSLGENIQTRSLHYLDDGVTEAAFVSGRDIYDGRGRLLKSYNSYYDMIAPGGVEAFTPLDEVAGEVNAYYNGTYDYDCQGYPYSEYQYDHDIKGRVIETSSPGYDWRMDSGHTTSVSYDNIVNSATQYFISQSTDPDKITSKSVNDSWNRITYDTSYYTDSDSLQAKLIHITYSSEKGNIDSVAISDGTNQYTLRKSWYSDNGFQDSLWVVDYGTVRKMFDLSGNLRFEWNDKNLDDTLAVYYKYDVFDRKIEEGTMSSNLLQQFLADFRDFPFYGYPGVEIKYRWEYDKKDGDINYGKLVYITNTDSSYYQKFHYSPFEYKDSVVTKLDIAQGDLKSIVHKYDSKNGQLEKKVIYPYQSSFGVRSIDYNYDRSGRIKSVAESKADGSGLGYQRNYVEYDYFLGNRVKRKRLGVYSNSPQADTVQVMDYSYNSLGMLTGINNPDSIDIYPGGIGEANPHFGLEIDYTNNGNGYYNGRVARVKTANTTHTYYKAHDYTYTYNELGWLISADNAQYDANDRKYYYNMLGNRDSVTFGTSTKVYDYNPSAGSSQLWGFNGGAHNKYYDVVGNMYQDNANFIYQMDYDYRNQIDYAKVKESIYDPNPQKLFFAYNESGKRISKKFYRTFKVICDGPYIEDPFIGLDQSSGGDILPEAFDKKLLPTTTVATEKTSLTALDPGSDNTSLAAGVGLTYCIVWDTVASHYLYDEGTLVMIFDKDDNVEQTYVHGKGSTVAVYEKNDDTKLAYQISDQVGSTRLMLDESGYSKYYAFYHPFGDLIEEHISYDEPFKFTGKEYDRHSTFNYYYFGARYYNPVLGRYTSIDKAAQFASGYIYGNNPILGVDPDGNFFIPALAIALKAYAVHSTMQLAMNVTDAAIQGQWNSVVKQVGMAGAGYAIGMGTGKLLGDIGGTSRTAFMTRGAVGGVLSNGISNKLSNRGFFQGAGKAAIFGAANGLVAKHNYDKKQASIAASQANKNAAVNQEAAPPTDREIMLQAEMEEAMGVHHKSDGTPNDVLSKRERARLAARRTVARKRTFAPPVPEMVTVGYYEGVGASVGVSSEATRIDGGVGIGGFGMTSSRRPLFSWGDKPGLDHAGLSISGAVPLFSTGGMPLSQGFSANFTSFTSGYFNSAPALGMGISATGFTQVSHETVLSTPSNIRAANRSFMSEMNKMWHWESWQPFFGY